MNAGYRYKRNGSTPSLPSPAVTPEWSGNPGVQTFALNQFWAERSGLSYIRQPHCNQLAHQIFGPKLAGYLVMIHPANITRPIQFKRSIGTKLQVNKGTVSFSLPCVAYSGLDHPYERF